MTLPPPPQKSGFKTVKLLGVSTADDIMHPSEYDVLVKLSRRLDHNERQWFQRKVQESIPTAQRTRIQVEDFQIRFSRFTLEELADNREKLINATNEFNDFWRDKFEAEEAAKIVRDRENDAEQERRRVIADGITFD